jgi:hypothetical protein
LLGYLDVYRTQTDKFLPLITLTTTSQLTSDGLGWVDDFAVKGPAPDAAKLSWDKSPVANGAHYFLFGRVDANDPPGVLREKGFGVEFPNYIVGKQVSLFFLNVAWSMMVSSTCSS